MSHAHDLLQRVLEGDHGGKGFHWDRIMAAMRTVAAGDEGHDGSVDLPPESEQLLLELLDMERSVVLSKGSSIPHAMPPADTLRSHAMQTLARWNKDKHRETIHRIATAPYTHERLASIAQKILSED